MTSKRLPDAELEVLACIWRLGEATVRDIREAISPYRPLAHASVVTLLNRLEEKGLVRRRKAPVGKAFIYKATRAPSKTYERVVGDLVERVFGGDGIAMVASLLESQPISQDEIARLQLLLDELKRGKEE